MSTQKQAELLLSLGCNLDAEQLSTGEAASLIKQLIEKNTTTIDTETIKRNANLFELASRYTELRKAGTKRYAGACPKCGGYDRFTIVNNETFYCRQCYEHKNNRPHDAIGFIMWMENCDFLAACDKLSNGNLPTSVVQVTPVRKVQPANATHWDEAKERSRVEKMHALLLRGNSGYARLAMEYLTERGITLDTIRAFKIGCRRVTLPETWDESKKQLSHPNQWAISLPWFNHDGALVCIKYRFIESHTYIDIKGKERTENKTSRGSSSGQIFGWQALRGSQTCHTLVICEGEMNASSIWQAGNGLIDVLSPGTEAMLTQLPPFVIEIAKQYQNVIIWADKSGYADNAARLIPNAKRFHSPIVDGYPKGLDANDILKAGKLSALLSAMTESVGVSIVDDLTVNEMDILTQVEMLLDDSIWERQRDARWVYRWLEGLTEDTPHTRRNVEAAAQRLGVPL